ncbi:hypothetical protein HPC49_31000 [Pyxidicoccus fallax]|uniref:Lipoprotein n=1 Tax=Pyxidicoccus fallax TaxID=394095 RepID=A0A848LGJ7_9BACT|nr:hypothetical protein [Pyxidicoccus fallax]NMO15791.1 hypothetical protein [Pyxidicoccus fallax]NPC82639.1 hypothetical protein [Pyxidicoccus fallax]
MKRLVWCVLLAASLSGCRIFGEPRPTPDTCPEPGPVPAAPPVKELPPGASPPPGATHVVGFLCQETGAFHAAGVNVRTRSFTYLVSGTRAARESFLANAYKAGVPVVLYTAPVKVPGARRASGGVAAAAGATSGETSSGADDETLDPCIDANEIGDDPPPDPKDPGNAGPKPIETLTRLAWTTAIAVDGVSDPVTGSGTQPVPGAPVPR